MKYLLICGFHLSLAAYGFGESESKCFQSDALQGKRSVVFKLDGNQVSGVFSIEKEGEAASYVFTGVRSGDTLRVKFAHDIRPDLAPSEMKDLEWKLVAEGDSEVLRIKLYGKNHETNEYADYFADFESCEPSFERLAKTAKRVSGSDKPVGTMTEKVTFETPEDRQAFWLKLSKGQSLLVEVPGASISLYFPDKKQDEEGGIDVLSREKVSQDGNYLVVLRPAGEPGELTVKFTITN